MKTVLSCRRSPLSFRALTVVCAIAVSSYILFNYLDLDRSNWTLVQYPGSGKFFVVTESIEVKPTALPKMLDGWELVYDHFSSPQKPQTCFLAMSETRMLGLESLRHRSYRVTLPRSSISDPLPPV
jgi:hypothetical protein